MNWIAKDPVFNTLYNITPTEQWKIHKNTSVVSVFIHYVGSTDGSISYFTRLHLLKRPSPLFPRLELVWRPLCQQDKIPPGLGVRRFTSHFLPCLGWVSKRWAAAHLMNYTLKECTWRNAQVCYDDSLLFSLWVFPMGCSMVGQVMQTIDFDGLLATGNEVGDAAGAVAVVSPRFAWCVLCWESCFPAKKQLQLQNVTF